MGDWIYALTQRGRQECAGVTSSVPPALRELLRLVDGKRTRDEVLAATGKSAVSAGGADLVGVQRLHRKGAATLARSGQARGR